MEGIDYCIFRGTYCIKTDLSPFFGDALLGDILPGIQNYCLHGP